MSRIALVVAVYNVHDYLDECLASLTSQTLGDLEIVCVNDGSTDGSRDLLDAWAARDARIRIIDKVNGGPSSARNVGLASVGSDFVCFPDADDRMVPTACETIVSTFDRTGADVVTFGATCFPRDLETPWLREVLSPRDVTYDGFVTDLLFKESSRPFAWRTACRTDLLRSEGIRFEESLSLGEDQAFQFAVYPRSRRTALISDRLYEYRVGRTGSLMGMGERDHVQKLLAHVRVVECILADWERGGLLAGHESEMVDFALGFALYGALKFEDDAYRSVASALRAVLLRYWTSEDVRAMALPAPVRRAALRACYRDDLGRGARRRLALAWCLERDGLGTTLRKLTRR